MIDASKEELEVFFKEFRMDPKDAQNKTKNYHGILFTLLTIITSHGFFLFVMTYLNKKLMISFAVEDFPLVFKVNPLFVSMGQFLFSSIFLFPFCARQFFSSIQSCIGNIMLTAVSYIATITSSMTILYFFNPPPYYQLRSFSISCAFFIGFFNKHFYNFPDTIIAVSLMICGSLLSASSFPEYYFPFLVYGIASSVASVQYPFSLRKSLELFKKKFILLAFSLNVCSFIFILPFALSCTDFSIFQRNDFKLKGFLLNLIFSGFVSGILCLTSALLIYFSTPLHYIVFSTTKQSILILFQAFINPVQRVLTPKMFVGHLICVASGIVVYIFHIIEMNQKTLIPIVFPNSLLRLLGILD